MKTILLSLSLFSLITFKTVAQPTLTSADGPKVGDVSTTQYIDATTLSQGPAGASQTWDFSAVTISGSPVTANYVAPSSTPNASQFTTATATLSESGAYVYIQVTGSAELLLGDATSAGNTIYTTPEELIGFPFTYNSHFTQAFAGNGTTSYSFNRSGTATVTADGYGKVITPAGTFNNALRVKTYQVYSDTFPSIGFAYYYNYTTYDWYIDGFSSPVFNVSFDTTTIFGTPTVANSGYYTTDVPAGIASISIPSELSVYPIPTSSEIFIQSANKINKLEVVNLLGEKVIDIQTTNFDIDKPLELSIANLPDGIYICNAITTEGILSRKIIKAE